MTSKSENRLTMFASSLDESGVVYSIFKGMPNGPTELPPSGSDIDMLVNENDARRFANLAAGSGFIPDTDSPIALGTHVRVWRSFDVSTGKFIMLHVHFKLCVSHAPALRLGIESLVLEQSEILDGVRIASPPVRALLSSCFKLLADTTIDSKSLDFNDPEVQSILESLVAKTGSNVPTNSDELQSALKSIAPKHAIRSACDSSCQLPKRKFLPTRRIFPRNKLGTGISFSVLTDGHPDSDHSINLTQDMVSEVMRFKSISEKTGLLGFFVSPLNTLRSKVFKARGFLVLIRKSKGTRTTPADIALQITSSNGQIHIVPIRGSKREGTSSIHTDPRNAAIKIVDQLVGTITPQAQQ
jgi:hypothetical protein